MALLLARHRDTYAVFSSTRFSRCNYFKRASVFISVEFI